MIHHEKHYSCNIIIDYLITSEQLKQLTIDDFTEIFLGLHDGDTINRNNDYCYISYDQLLDEAIQKSYINKNGDDNSAKNSTF